LRALRFLEPTAVHTAAALLLLVLAAGCTGSVISGESVGTPVNPDATVSDADGTTTPDGTADADPDGQVDADVNGADGDVGPDVPVVVPDWSLGSLGDLGVLDNVYAVSPKQAYAAGGSRVLRYNGRTWASYGEPLGTDSQAQMHGVWSDGATTIVVGDLGTIARRGVEELSWSLDTVPTDADLHAVYGRAADDIWAVGDRTTILHYDGTEWTEVHSGEGLTLHAVWAPEGTTGPDDVLAAGTKGRIMRYKDGGFQPQQIAAGSVTLYGVTGAGEARFAVGTEATITMRANANANWQGQASNDTQDRDLFGIVAASDDNVVAVGAAGAIIRFDGDKWNVEPSQSPTFGTADYRSITYAGAGQSAWLVVAATGGGVSYDSQEEAWVDMATRPESELRHIAGSDQLWAAGRTGLLMTETASGWTAVKSGLELDLNDIEVATDGTVWAVGDSGTVLRRLSDGTISVHELAVPVALYGVAVDGTDVVVAGKGGTLLSAASAAADPSFTPRASGTPSDLRAVTFGGDGALWLAGAFGTLLRSDAGGTPIPVVTGVGGSLNSMAATSDGVVVAGDNGVLIKATSAGADLLYEQPGLFLYGVSYASDVGFAVGWNGTVLRLDGTTVTTEVSGTSAVLEAVWHNGSRAIATGRQGVLLTRVEAP